ncbi:MAG: hypothetical protein ACKPKO_54940, partial [Candidatus Fonsibacter sp.]
MEQGMGLQQGMWGLGHVQKGKVQSKTVAMIKIVSMQIVGRCMSISLVSGHVDVLVVVAYYPPRAQGVTYQRTVEKVSEFTDKALDEIPARTLPIVCGDVNDGFGMQRMQ